MDRRETQGLALKAWREANGLTQRQAGERLADFNDEKRTARQAAWWSWERGEKSPDLFFAFALERMTGGRVMAQGWAISRDKPSAMKADPDSTTNLLDGEALGKAG